MNGTFWNGLEWSGINIYIGQVVTVEDSITHLQELCEDAQWTSLLVKWVELERQLGFPRGRSKANMLASSNHPAQGKKGRWWCADTIKDVEWVLDQMIISAGAMSLDKRDHTSNHNGPASKCGRAKISPFKCPRSVLQDNWRRGAALGSDGGISCTWQKFSQSVLRSLSPPPPPPMLAATSLLNTFVAPPS
ncbi:hypothetical protein FIBSPDRAFT_1027543 [Athelia psychrophila]|uniref:Uncharacterized protein n=1 Tax=Athelia psychrophila TaxID=1759441 RepID=A0A166H3N0_9AGAM|nr:hypothetical protein FIBSPDRAFT_1027543 [Fibularhizoctonia sp. CBS 109695]